MQSSQEKLHKGEGGAVTPVGSSGSEGAAVSAEGLSEETLMKYADVRCLKLMGEWRHCICE